MFIQSLNKVDSVTFRSDMMTHYAGKRWLRVELPVVDYPQTLELQRQIVHARHNNVFNSDMVILLEHFPVFTLGRRGGLSNLKISPKIIEKENIPIVQTERGGNITYHGPGQLVVYPVIDLNAAGMQAVDYVERLEEVMIRVLGEWGISAERNPQNRGIWVNSCKIGSLGIAVRRAVCFHGFALNVNLSLEPFGWINSCGIEDIGVTSMQQELSQRVSMNQVRRAVTRHLMTLFDIDFSNISLLELQNLIKKPELEAVPNI
jgi:lipoate-protein ligase B